ncbi:MAG: Ig-like domain-containing protein, partial [Methanosarcinales archaeon]|nr:Ig-like domain-containing protein [Methanosarcinales archaeon]
MRLLLIIGILAMLSMGIASADNMTIAEGTNVTFADNRTVQIMVNLTNATGHPVNDTRVNFTATLGTLHASYNCTNASGIAVVNLSSWDLGTANVTAQAPNAANVSVNVTFVRGPVSRIVLAHSFSGTVNTTHLITATVYDKTIWEFSDDENKWRVMPNVTLNFSITPPPSSTYDSANITPKSNTTNESGTTTAIALIDKCAGNNLITVNTTNEDNNMVQVSGAIVGIAGEPTFLFMSANPENISANGIDTSKVTGEVTDEFGNPLIERGSVRFNSSSGDIITKPLDD